MSIFCGRNIHLLSERSYTVKGAFMAVRGKVRADQDGRPTGDSRMMSASPIPILMYHHVDIPRKDARMRGLYVLPRRFRMQMRMLKYMGYQGLSMSGLQPFLRGEKSAKVVGITFDDGYLNNLSNALPILTHYGFQATCYLVAGHLGGHNHWDIAKGIARQPLMDQSQVGAWLDAGMEIGSHTHEHVNTTVYAGSELQDQIQGSKLHLESTFGVPVKHFCYPYGSYDPQVVSVVGQAGYETATTTRRSRARPADPMLELPRVPVYRSTLPHLFWAKIQTGYEDRKG